MTDLRKAAEMALEALDCLPWQASPISVEATKALRQALALEKFSEVNQEIEQALKQPRQEAFNRLIRIMGTFDLATGHADSWNELLDSLESELRDVLGHLRTRREWVGLTYEEIQDVWDHSFSIWGVARQMEEKLKEKNT